MLIKWVNQYRDLLRDVFVRLALLSMSEFRSYICMLGTLWFCYITYKLFSLNPGTYLPQNIGNLPLPFLVVITLFLSWIIFNNDCICILTGSPG